MDKSQIPNLRIRTQKNKHPMNTGGNMQRKERHSHNKAKVTAGPINYIFI